MSKLAVEKNLGMWSRMHPGKPRKGFALALNAGNMLDLPVAQED